MVMLAAVFFVMLIASCAIMFFFMRPTREESITQKRIISLVAASADAKAKAQETLETYLQTKDRGPFFWFEDIVGTTKFAEWLRTLLLRANTSWPLGTLLASMSLLGAAALLLSLFVTNMLALSLIIGFVAMLSPISFLYFRKSRRLAQFEKELPDCIDLCARSLRAGHSMAATIGILAEQSAEPAKTEFSEVFKHQNHGLPLRDALQQMVHRVPSRDLQVLVTGILVQKDTGGNLAEIMDRIALVIRERVRIQGDIKTHTAQGRLTGWILCLLPVVLLLVINMLNPGYSGVLFHDPVGRKMLYAGMGLLLVGCLVIRQIVNGVEI